MSFTNRGRSSSTYKNKTRSPSRGRANIRGRGRLGFFDQRTVDEEQKKLDDIRADVSNLKTFVENRKQAEQDPKQAANISKRNEKINATIEKGKEFVSKFFRGFNQPDRGNVKVTVSESLPQRMTNPYIAKIITYADLNYQSNPEETAKNLFYNFHGITEIGLAIKLYRSSTEFDRNLNFKYSSVRNLDVPLPKKMNVLINQIGKTDLLNDNRIRLKHQHLLVKRFLLRGCCIYMQSEINQYLSNGVKWDHVTRTLYDDNYFYKTIDSTIGSLDVLKKIGREYFEYRAKTNFNFKMNDKVYVLRLPYFDFDNASVKSIKAYFENGIFNDFTFDNDVIAKIIGSLVFQIANYKWLRRRDETIAELDSNFENTVVADYKFKDILDYAGVVFIDDFIEEDVLDDVTNEVIKRWKSGTSTHFQQMFNMEEIKFSEFGTDAQLVEIDKFQTHENEFGDKFDKILNRTKSETILKTSEHGAILGSILAISKHVEFSSKFVINYDSKNDQILQEFVKSDFKT